MRHRTSARTRTGSARRAESWSPRWGRWPGPERVGPMSSRPVRRSLPGQTPTPQERPVLDLHPATREVARLLDGVSDDQLGAPDPRADYDVATLLEHLLGLTLAFTWAAEKSAAESTAAANPRNRRVTRARSRLAHGAARSARRPRGCVDRPRGLGGHDRGRWPGPCRGRWRAWSRWTRSSYTAGTWNEEHRSGLLLRPGQRRGGDGLRREQCGARPGRQPGRVVRPARPGARGRADLRPGALLRRP